MIDLPVIIHSAGIHPGVEQHLHEGDHDGKYQPDIHHLHIGSGGKRARNTDEQCSQDKEGGEVDGDNSFKEEVFEEVGSVDNAQK